MSAEAGTRDGLVAAEIARAGEPVEDLAQRLAYLVTEAEAADASAHARLYERVREYLAEAADCLGNAHELMRDGDPEAAGDREGGGRVTTR